MQVIGIQQMLSDMERTRNDGTGHEFHIVCIKGTRKAVGEVREFKRVRKLGHAAGHNHKDHGTLPLWDAAKKRPITPFLDNIIFYNGMKVLA